MSQPEQKQPRWFVFLIGAAALSPIAHLVIALLPWFKQHAAPFIGWAIIVAFLAGVFCGGITLAFKAPRLLEKTRWWFRSRKAEHSLSKALDRKAKADYEQAQAETAAMATAAYASSTQTVTNKKTRHDVERMVQQTSQRVLESRLDAIDAVVNRYMETQSMIANSEDLSEEEKAKLYEELEDLAAYPELADAFAKQRREERARERKKKEQQQQAAARQRARQKLAATEGKQSSSRSTIALKDRWEPVIKQENCYEVLTEKGPKLVPARKYREAQPTPEQLAAELEMPLLSDAIKQQRGFVVRFESLTDATPWRAFHQEYHAVAYLLRLALVKIPDPQLHERMEERFLELSSQREADSGGSQRG